MWYRLHYAPDNASPAIRLALGVAGVPFTPVLADRRAGRQKAPGYLAPNPNGQFPVPEILGGVLFETGAFTARALPQPPQGSVP